MIRKAKVVPDADLAGLDGVATKRLDEAVKRNVSRIPADFRFRLTKEEAEKVRSQTTISRGTHGGLRQPPWVFTEHGALRAAHVRRSERAAE